MKARRKGSLSWWILLALEKTTDGYVRFEHFAYNPGLYAYYDYWDRPLKKSELAQAFKRLREQGIVREDKVGQDLIFKLTDAGKDLILGSETNNENWDRKWRIVIFDIPEEKRVVRDLFRRNLKKWGFNNLQKSVWISKKDIFDKLKGYIAELGIEKWVIIIESEKISF
ncbi:MAG: hypothetical protein Q7R97_01080 [Candidatus Daviesbacteria bacterium]|nr:hypothetical protein [Candidatus Daviesbacteria bacterium]